MDIVLGAIFLIIYIALVWKFTVEERKEIKRKKAEEEEFELKRLQRRIAVVYRDKQTCRSELIAEWAKVGKLGYYRESE